MALGRDGSVPPAPHLLCGFPGTRCEVVPSCQHAGDLLVTARASLCRLFAGEIEASPHQSLFTSAKNGRKVFAAEAKQRAQSI